VAATQKLSVSIGIEEAKWIRARARRKRKSVSAVVTEALATVRQLEARREFLAKLEASELATDAEADEIRKEWRG
jgi:Arc/MetJ-type ribon-helix-helix transcriptional regulator